MAIKLKDDEIKWILSLDAKGVQSDLKELSSSSQALADDNKKLEADLKATNKQLERMEKQLEKVAETADEDSDELRYLKDIVTQTKDEIATYSKQIEANKKVIKENSRVTDEMVKSLKLEDMTMEQLTKRAKELEKQLDNTSKSTSPESYEALDKELNSVKSRMGELKGGTNDAKEEFSLFSKEGAKGMTKILIGLTAAKKGWEAYNHIMMSNKATSTELKAEMDGLNNAWDYMKTAIANVDFTNFLQNMKESIRLGREASLMLDELFERDNSFKLTAAPIRTEIEDMKTEMRDPNLTLEKRIRLGEKIIAQTEYLGKLEKDNARQKVDATEMLLQSQTNLVGREREYVITNYNKNRESILIAKQILSEEQKISRSKTASSAQEIELNSQLNKEVQGRIDLLKKSSSYSDEAYTSIKKYMQADNEVIGNYVNAKESYLNIDAKTSREKSMTERMVNELTKKKIDNSLGGRTPEQRQKNELNKINENLAIKHQNELARIKQEYKDRDFKDEAKFNRKVAVADSASYATRKLALEKFLENPLEPRVRLDVQKQIAEINNKILDQEIVLRKKIDKIILDADPVAKENLRHEEELSALELFGVEKENMTIEQLQAIELLEKQHKENLEQIQRQADARKKAQSEKEFKESFSARKGELQLELNDLIQIQTATGRLGFDAEMEVHMKRLQMLQEEVQARKDAGAEMGNILAQIGRVEAQMTNTLKKESDKRTADYNRYATSAATATEGYLLGQQSMVEAFGGSIIDTMFDIISQIINQKIMEATAVAIAEQAKAAAIAAALPDSVLTFGASAAARTAAIGAIIMGALQVAKGALKGMISQRKSSSSSSSERIGQSTGQIIVNRKGYADGGYNDAGVVGGYTGDGSRYEVAGAFTNNALYHRREYIVPDPVLQLPAAVPYIRALENLRMPFSRNNPLPNGFADGGMNNHNTDSPIHPNNIAPEIYQEMISLLRHLSFKGVKANIGTTELQAQMKQDKDIDDLFSMKR